MLFGCSRQNINHSSENLKVIYMGSCLLWVSTAISTNMSVDITHSKQDPLHVHKVLYVLCNNQLKDVEELVKQTVQALKSY